MAERGSRESNEGGRWMSTVLLSVIVMAAGVALGIVAGVGWEEPGLVLSYLTGDTENVDWAERDTAVPEPDTLAEVADIETPPVAAAPPLGYASSETTPKRAAAPAPPKRASVPAPEPRAAAAPGDFAIQVGAFAEQAAARKLADSLRQRGYGVYLSRADADRGATFRVRVGPLPSREAAERTAKKLESGEKLPTWVLSEGS